MSVDLETARLLFDGHRLAHARQFRGLLKGQLAAEVGVSAAAIGQFESGVARPSASTLARLAIALGVPVSFFSQGRPSFPLHDEDAHFRSLRSTSKRDRARARAQVERLGEVVAAVEARVRLPDVDIPEIPEGTAPEEAARIVRAAWQVGDGPIMNMVRLLERRGVIVARLPAATDEVDAFSCWIGMRPFVILASNKGDAARSRFDCGHELAHVLLHPDAKPGDPQVEREAHRFAAELLTPAAPILEELPRRVDWRALLELKLRWRVAISMLLFRARELSVISDAAYRRAMMEMSRRGWRRDEPASLGDPETPELLGRAMALLASKRQYTLDDLSGELALGSEGLAVYDDLLRPIEPLVV